MGKETVLFQILFILVLIHILCTWLSSIRRGWLVRKRTEKKPDMCLIQQPPVSILIPAWCERGTIEQCIRSLQKLEYSEWEALVLAGGHDGTFEAASSAAARDARFRILSRGPEPKNAAIMQGVQAARHEILVLLDADSLVFPDWLFNLVQPFSSGAAASFGMHYPARETWVSMSEQMGFIQAYYSLGRKLGAGCSSLAIRKETLERIGPLPVDAYSWEDWDLDVRLLDAGEQIAFTPGARLISDRPTNLGEYWSIILRSFRTHWVGVWYHRQVFLRHPMWGIMELFFLVYGAAVSLAAIASLIATIVQPTLLTMVGKTLVLFALWTLGRYGVLGVEVAVTTGEHKWLSWAWAPLVLLPFQFIAALVAVVTVWKQPTYDYKGPRSLSPT